MGSCFDFRVSGLFIKEELTAEEEYCEPVVAKHPKKKLQRSPPVRLEDLLLCGHIPLQSALKMQNKSAEEEEKKKKCVRFSDEICIFGAHRDEDEYSPDSLRVKIVLTKEEAAKAIAISSSQGQKQGTTTLKDLLMQLSKEKEFATFLSHPSP